MFLMDVIVDCGLLLELTKLGSVYDIIPLFYKNSIKGVQNIVTQKLSELIR